MKFLTFNSLLPIAASLLLVQGQFQDIVLVARTYHAAGYVTPDGLGNTKPDLFGYGLGALEQIAYDPLEQIVYGTSDQGYVSVIDFGNGPANAEQLDFSIPFLNSLTDLEVCEGYLFVSSKNDPELGRVSIFATAKRGTDGTISRPELIQEVEVGVGPDMILPDPTCTMVGVANEGEGEYADSGLIDPEGSVSIIKGPFNGTIEVVQISLNNWTDNELIAKGIHLPLPLNALEYWDEHSPIASDLNFSSARDNYQPASNLEPEYVAWSADSSILFVSLQENCGLILIDVASGTIIDIFSYGLKDWSTTGIDVVEDNAFTSVVVEGLYTTRTPDSIATVTVDGDTYIITANEGDDKEYGFYAERVEAGLIFNGSSVEYGNMTADISVFNPSDITLSPSRYFNFDCNITNVETPFCSSGMRVTLGSSMVNYTDPTAPNIYRFVGLGGRGISVYKVNTTELTLVWDSADQFEVEGAAAFPWAHNGIQDEEFAPINGTLYKLADDELKQILFDMNDPALGGCADQGDGTAGACPMGQTIDARTLSDGPAAEAVVVGTACGSTFLVTATEKNSVGYLYNIDNIVNPELVKVFHLSEASELLSPGLAYEARTLGDIDSESIIFLDATESPTGRSAVMFAGAWSGTISYWELLCEGDNTTESVGPATSSPVAAPTTVTEPPVVTSPIASPIVTEQPAIPSPVAAPDNATAPMPGSSASMMFATKTLISAITVVVCLWN